MESKSSRTYESSSKFLDEDDYQDSSKFRSESKGGDRFESDCKTTTFLKPQSKESKEKRQNDMDDQEEADLEFEALKRKPNTGSMMVSTDPRAVRIASGFRINYMNMKDGSTGELVWESRNFGAVVCPDEIIEYIPSRILDCSFVSREINFSSREAIQSFRIEQRVFFQGNCIEEWFFQFGFVIPGSSNSWQQSIAAAPRDEMLPAEAMSGQVTFETSFFDDKLLLCKNLVRIFYV